MSIVEFASISPQIPDDAWVAPTAVLTGNVWLATGVSIWYGAVLRGDNGAISIGEGSNVQDLCVLHAVPGNAAIIGKSCSIGHAALLHGCRIGDCSLIGMGAILLDGVEIGRNCLIGAATLIPAGTIIPDNAVVIGQPGRIIRLRDPREAEELRAKAHHYELQWRHYPVPHRKGAA